MSDKIPMTPSGKTKLLAELKNLRTVERPANVAAIEEARSHGDLSENADYTAAKERQSYLEGRIAQLEDWLARAEIIDVTKLSTDRVTFGATVRLRDEDTEKEMTYRIVGEFEAEPKHGLISVKSPIARALIGKEKDDEVSVPVPGGGNRVLVILEISVPRDEAAA